MGKYPVYAIVAIVFIGIIKLLQVTAFDSEKYNKNKKLSFAKPEGKTEMPYKKEDKVPENVPKEAEKQAEVKTEEPPTLTSENSESQDQNQEMENTVESETTTFENTPDAVETKTYSGLSELKNLYLAPKIASLPPGQLREDVVIRYYRHELDGDKVYTLKELGYYIHEKEANETAGLGSNVLYYGDEVQIEDIQIVAYVLLENGLPIKAIVPTQFSWKSTSMEVGTDTLLIDAVTLSEDDIKTFSK